MTTKRVRMTSRDTRSAPITTCFGGGAAFGIAYGLGVACGLQDIGLPIISGNLMGTSAGSWVAAATATGVSLDRMVPIWKTPEPDGKRRRCITAAGQLWHGLHDDRVIGVTAVLPFFRRRLLLASEHTIADVVAASSSLPGFAAAHRIDEGRYIDGGVLSPASIDRAPKADLLIAVVPLAGVPGPVGMGADAVSRIELTSWGLRHRRRSLYIRPDRRFRRHLRWIGDLMLTVRLSEVYEAAREQGEECGQRWQANAVTCWAA
jgi:predicted acylesterase/phospholipase RssA